MQNQVRTTADQAAMCASSCLMNSIGLAALKNGTFELKADVKKEEANLFTDEEASCIDNCAYKVFTTDKVMRAYLPSRFAGLKINQNEME